MAGAQHMIEHDNQIKLLFISFNNGSVMPMQIGIFR
jgi:hypothetical protein